MVYESIPQNVNLQASNSHSNGHILFAKGISPDPEKLKIIIQPQILMNVSEIKSLLAMTNFCNKFIPDYSTVTASLLQLTKKDEPFHWGPQ